MHTRDFYLTVLAMVLAFGLGASFVASAAGHIPRETEDPTALDRYVAAEDDAYAWRVESQRSRGDTAIFVLHLTSQRWESPVAADRDLWEHWLVVAVPAEVDRDTALLYIGGGSNGDDAPRGASLNFVEIARATGCVVAQLGQVPNQPLTFEDEENRRSEDSLIAYTWDKYMRTGDERWPLRLPMTKSATSAMTCIQEFAASEEAGGHAVSKFVVSGGSKRGWTTWTAAAVDQRVVAIVPAVIDLLNVVPSFRHHYAVYGFWAPAVRDYDRMEIFDRMETPEFAALMDIEEPFEYRDRLTMPKYLVNAAGDQFFLPDSAQFYVHDIYGPTWLGYTANAGHSLLGGENVFDGIQAFVHAVVDEVAIPRVTWRYDAVNRVSVEATAAPATARLWQAYNPVARDFRIDQLGREYESTPLTPDADGTVTGTVEVPDAGWRAYFVELEFPGAGEKRLRFTTPVKVIPEETENAYWPLTSDIPGFLSATPEAAAR